MTGFAIDLYNGGYGKRSIGIPVYLVAIPGLAASHPGETEGVTAEDATLPVSAYPATRFLPAAPINFRGRKSNALPPIE
jgi:hypothetical protein